MEERLIENRKLILSVAATILLIALVWSVVPGIMGGSGGGGGATSEAEIESWDMLVSQKGQGVFAGEVLAVDENTARFKIDRVIDPSSQSEKPGTVVKVVTRDVNDADWVYFKPGKQLAVALEWGSSTNYQREGYYVWTVYNVNKDGTVTGGEDAVKVEKLPLAMFKRQVQAARKGMEQLPSSYENLPGEKQSIAQRIAKEQDHTPRAPKASLEPGPSVHQTDPPTTEGVFEEGNAEFPWDFANIQNHWQADLPNGGYMMVFAGSLSANADQGVLVVLTKKDRVALERYPTPDKRGAVKIMSVDGSNIKLVTETREQLTFNLETRSFSAP